MDVTKLKIREMRKLLDTKEVSAVELTKEYIDRISKYNDKFEVYITKTEDLALENAKKSQAVIDSGNAPMLCGIPMAIKDNICTEGVKTTCASRILENFIPPYNATAMDNLA